VLAVVFFAVSALLTYWVIRLAVRHGVNDALRTNRELLGKRIGDDGDDGDGAPTR
jgi:hypothetical protein